MKHWCLLFGYLLLIHSVAGFQLHLGKLQRHLRRPGLIIASSASPQKPYNHHADIGRKAFVQRQGLSLGFLIPAILAGQVQRRKPAYAAEKEEAAAPAKEDSTLKTLVTSSKLFSFDHPASWVLAPKPVQTHQEEVTLKSTIVKGFSGGVAVDPVKIDGVQQAGSPADVGNRIVKLEGKKDGVLSVELIESSQETRDDKLYYLFDYKVESTRGKNRYLAKAAVQDRRLIVFTVQIPIAIYADYEPIIKNMITSFKVAP